MRKLTLKFLSYLAFLVIGVIVGYGFGGLHKSVKECDRTQIPFDLGGLCEILVAVKNDEERHCGGPCFRSVTYVQAMNDSFALVKSVGIDGPGAYYIYEKTGEGWRELTGGGDYPTESWLKKRGIPLEWFY